MMSDMSQFSKIGKEGRCQEAFVQVLRELGQHEIELFEDTEDAADGPGRRNLAEPRFEIRVEQELRVAAEPEEQDVPDERREELERLAELLLDGLGEGPEPLQEQGRTVARNEGLEEGPGLLLEALDFLPFEVHGSLEVPADEEGKEPGLLRAEIALEEDLLELLPADRRKGQRLAAGEDGREEEEGAGRHQDEVRMEGRLLEDLEQGVGGGGAP